MQWGVVGCNQIEFNAILSAIFSRSEKAEGPAYVCVILVRSLYFSSSTCQRASWGCEMVALRGQLTFCRVGGGALARWPPSAAQTARTIFS
jgi:hypothetical protein